MQRAPTGGAPGGSYVLGSSQFSMSFPRNAFLILTHTFWYTHSHSAEPLPASIFPGYFTNAYPQPPIFTLSHGSNCYSIFAPVLKRCERQMSVFQVSERWASLSVLAAALLLRERGCSCLCTELLEREWGRMWVPGLLLVVWKELLPGRGEECKWRSSILQGEKGKRKKN